MQPRQETTDPIVTEPKRDLSMKTKPSRAPPVHSLAELERMSVAQLREMLSRRGVPGNSATEKRELAKWVWQHQHIPWQEGEEGPKVEPAEPKVERKQLEAPELKEETKLLEAPPVAESRTGAALVAASLVLLGLLAAVVANDARQAEEKVCEMGSLLRKPRWCSQPSAMYMSYACRVKG